MSDPFDSAKFYTCSEPGRLESPEEALEEYLDGDISTLGDGPVADFLQRLCPLTVFAYSPKKIDPSVAPSLALDLAFAIAQRFHEEDLGDPDGYASDNGFDAETLSAIADDLLPAVQRGLAQGSIWACDEVAKREYSAEEVEKMMREHCPEWFEGVEDEK